MMSRAGAQHARVVRAHAPMGVMWPHS
jgi:hypothetical protein